MTSNAGKTGGTRQSLEDVCSHAVTLMLLSIQAGGAAIGLFHQMKTGFFGGFGHDHRLHRADISVNGWGNIASVNWLEVSCLGNRGKNFGRAKTIMASVNESQQRYGKRAGG